MKRVLLAMFFFAATVCTSWAQYVQFSAVAPSGQTVDYDIIDSYNYYVSVTYSSSGYYGNLIIPDQVIYQSSVYTVTAISSDAFSYCIGLTSVTIPNSVTTIGRYAFQGCSGLTSISIPNSVTDIGRNAFQGCSGLTTITIPNSVTYIDTATFSNCSGLT